MGIPTHQIAIVRARPSAIFNIFSRGHSLMEKNGTQQKSFWLHRTWGLILKISLYLNLLYYRQRQRQPINPKKRQGPPPPVFAQPSVATTLWNPLFCIHCVMLVTFFEKTQVHCCPFGIRKCLLHQPCTTKSRTKGEKRNKSMKTVKGVVILQNDQQKWNRKIATMRKWKECALGMTA